MEAARKPVLPRQEVQHRGARQAQRGPDSQQLQPVRRRAQVGRGQSEGRARRRHRRLHHAGLRIQKVRCCILWHLLMLLMGLILHKLVLFSTVSY